MGNKLSQPDGVDRPEGSDFDVFKDAGAFEPGIIALTLDDYSGMISAIQENL
jgi:hypothetical protein